MSNKQFEMDEDVIAETENFIVWCSQDGDDTLYHVELGGITLHITSEEWEEFVLLIKSV